MKQLEGKKVKNLFLIDGIGALVSAILLGVFLVKFEHLFGIPTRTLYLLAAIPCFFVLYDLYSYLKIDKRVSLFLKIIAYANILYCILSLVLAICHMDKITILGWIYIIGEVLIILGIALFEIKVARQVEFQETTQA